MTRLLTILLLSSCSLLGCAGANASAKTEAPREANAVELMRRGEASASVGDLTRAEQYFVASLRAGGNEKELTERLLSVCVADQRYPVAAEYAEQYLYHHPDDIDVAFAAGSLQSALGNTDRARELFERVVEKRPEWPEPHYALATLLRDEGEAIELAQRHDLSYLKLSPSGAFAETVRARLREATP